MLLPPFPIISSYRFSRCIALTNPFVPLKMSFLTFYLTVRFIQKFYINNKIIIISNIKISYNKIDNIHTINLNKMNG